MANKCKSYHLHPTTRYTYHPLTGKPIAHDIEVGVCWGTKECDQCNCGGDMTRCDFYPEPRSRALKDQEPKFGEWIGVDERLPEEDGRYLVAMKNGDNYHISTRKFKRADPPIWWKGHTFGYWARHTGGVRYWMPLPESPKDGENNA